MNQDLKKDFLLADGTYLLNHSVGRPLRAAQDYFQQRYLQPWQDSNREPWQAWLSIVDDFQQALGRLFNSPPDQFCPQTNLSSALTKLVMSLPRLQHGKPVVLMSEQDFPSMGFAMRQALPDDAEIRFIPASADITDLEVWQRQLQPDVDLVFVSHAYSNTGQQAPVAGIVAMAKDAQVLSVVDVAQSAGVLPLDLTAVAPDFMIGSSVKWLCSGPGAAYLWLHSDRLNDCEPKDVGWFSHDNPFEFDIHQFRYHNGALRFWGGTPSIAPFAFAAAGIAYFAELGAERVYQHNRQLMQPVFEALPDWWVGPLDEHQRSGTMILNAGARQPEVLAALAEANISVDARAYGMRVSPHVYNDDDDMTRLIERLQPFYLSSPLPLRGSARF